MAASEIDRLERRLADLEGRLGAAEYVLLYVVRPALEVAGGLGKPTTWRDALLDGAATYRRLVLELGGTAEQVGFADYIEKLAVCDDEGRPALQVIEGGKS